MSASSSITGGFVQEPPSEITGEFRFIVEIENNGAGQNFNIDAVLRDSQGNVADVITPLFDFIGAEAFKEYEFIITRPEIDTQNGDYNLDVVVSDIDGQPITTVASKPVTLNLPDNGSVNGGSDQSDGGFIDRNALIAAGSIAIIGGYWATRSKNRRR